MDSSAVIYGATALTANPDNAALTHLGSLVEGLAMNSSTRRWRAP
jgi:hypothetical protein